MDKFAEILEQIFHRYLDKKELNTPTQALEAMLEFYKTVQILPKVDDPDDDMLLFQYGVYDWDDTGDKFEFDLTRQVKSPDPGDDEFYQFSLTLLYEPDEMEIIEALNAWSVDSADLNTWKQLILNSEGYQQAVKHAPYSFRVELNHT